MKNQQISFTTVIESAAKLPLVHVNREDFLTRNLSKMCTPEQLQKALVDGTLNAGIPISILDSLANAIINAETLKVTSISAAAGIPGGWAMAATIPADLAQFYAFIIRIAQELAYIYGWTEISTESEELDDATQSQLLLFIGVMSGVKMAENAVGKLFGEVAMKSVAKKVASKALTKGWIYPLVKKIAGMLGQKMTKAIFAKGVSQAVPVVGAVISGGLTLASFKPMAVKLKKHLSKLASMSPKQYAEYESSLKIDEEDVIIDADEIVEEAVEVFSEDMEIPDVSCWICICGTENKGKFCHECGQKKPDPLPQYRCDKCHWEPDDRTKPPKFCPECGDPFDEGDIIVE